MAKPEIKPKKKPDLSRKGTGALTGKKAPKLHTMFDPRGLPPPPDIDASQELQAVADQEGEAVEDRLRSEYQNAFEQYRAEASPFFYFCVCFQTQAQKDEFLKATGWGERDGDLFVDGLMVAEAMGVHIEPIDVSLKPLPKTSGVFLRKEVIL
jgi:hypothetical protein